MDATALQFGLFQGLDVQAGYASLGGVQTDTGNRLGCVLASVPRAFADDIRHICESDEIWKWDIPKLTFMKDSGDGSVAGAG